MAIERMALVNIRGEMGGLDRVMVACSELGCFHPEPVSQLVRDSRSLAALQEENPYDALLERVAAMGEQAGLKPPAQLPQGNLAARLAQEDEAFLAQMESRLAGLHERRRELAAEMENHQNALVHLHHIQRLDVALEDLFACRYVKVRFGRIHQDNYPKLAYFENARFLFLPFDSEDAYCWGVYFTTAEFAAEADEVFRSLYFERIRIPDYVHGSPGNAIENMERELSAEREELDRIDREIGALAAASRAQWQRIYAQVRFLCESFGLRRFVATADEGRSFYIVGFVPQREQRRFTERLGRIEGIAVTPMPDDADSRFTPPTKLRNNWFSRPFEMFVQMYGTPSQKDVDPTSFVAITYTLLFGAMFGDVGQGLLIALLGFIAWRWRRMALGPVLERVGVSSALFGLLYGSVFGFEELLDPLYHAVGLPGKPVHVMDSLTINQILVAAVVAGVAIIVLAIGINIVAGLRQRDWDRAFFGQNSLAGLVFYCTLLGGVGLQLLGVNFLTAPVILLGIVLPLLVIFLKEPLAKLSRGLRQIGPEDGVGGYIAESFFELFEVALGFATNTMSFLRVGGFVLSHAGMMMVVFTLSEMVSAAAGPLVIVFGNLFVVALEGLIVGIQVLRLEFYEMFSRFYDGSGIPFEPVTVGKEPPQ